MKYLRCYHWDSMRKNIDFQDQELLQKELRKQARIIAAEEQQAKQAVKKVYKPRRRRGSIVADKAAKEARRRIRISKKAAKSQEDAVKKTRAPRRT